jgi:nitroreductase
MMRYSPKPLDFKELPVREMLEKAESFYALMNTRRSVRFFSDRAVPRALIEYAIKSAGTAPSGAHRQPWQFVAISNPEMKHQIRVAAEAEEQETYERRMSDEWRNALAPIGTDWQKPFLDTVPWIVVCFEETYNLSEDGAKVKNYYVQESVGIACGFFIAALHHCGLATLTHTPSPMKFLNKLLNRPANEKPYILFPIGYPTTDAVVPDLERKNFNDISYWIE